MRTNITRNMIKKIVSSDGLKANISGAYYEPRKETLTVTNGHVLLIHKVKSDKGDKSGIIPVDFFDVNTKLKTKYIIRDKAIKESKGKKEIHDLIDAKFPNIDAVIPNPRNTISFALNLTLLKDICDAVPVTLESDYRKTVIFTIDIDKPEIAPIQLKECTFGSNSPRYSGIIMPIRINN